MPGHTLAPSTQTVELRQLIQLNERLTEPVLLTAELLGLTGAPVRPRVVDRAAAAVLERRERRHETLILPAEAPLRALLAAGDPVWPYVYGIFDEVAGRRRLPVEVRAVHLRRISDVLGCHGHHWVD